jgi:uncharacterized Zn finger protein
MSRFGRFDWRNAAPKKAAPEHGIKMKKAGSTWWGQRWIEALEQVLKGDAGRLSRGRTYARAGRTHDLIIKDGKVSAKVTGSRATPYEIAISLKQLDGAAWDKAIAAMTAKAQFSAELLAGEMPREIDEAFLSAGSSLFPRQRTDLATQCSCPDWGDPCKHVAATHYVLGEALDRDPFLLFELRGRTKEQVLEALRAARRARGPAAPSQTNATTSRAKATTPPDEAAPEIAAVKLGKIKAADYDKPPQALPTLQFTFDEPLSHGAVLRQLGSPVGWTGEVPTADALAPLVRAAAASARKIALAEGVDAAAAAPEPHVVAPSVDRRVGEEKKRRPAKRRGKPTQP